MLLWCATSSCAPSPGTAVNRSTLLHKPTAPWNPIHTKEVKKLSYLAKKKKLHPPPLIYFWIWKYPLKNIHQYFCFETQGCCEVPPYLLLVKSWVQHLTMFFTVHDHFSIIRSLLPSDFVYTLHSPHTVFDRDRVREIKESCYYGNKEYNEVIWYIMSGVGCLDDQFVMP
jgi:hypothetical protein